MITNLFIALVGAVASFFMSLFLGGAVVSALKVAGLVFLLCMVLNLVIDGISYHIKK